MMDLKAKTVQFLTYDGANDYDRSAAKLLARCEVECLPLPPDRSDVPAADVLLHADTELLDEITSSNLTGRIERAIRRASGTTIRDLQWIEGKAHTGSDHPAGAGDGLGQSPSGQPKNPGDPPKFNHNHAGQPPAPPMNRGTPPQDNPTGLRRGG